MKNLTVSMLGAVLLASFAAGAQATTVAISADGSWNEFDVDSVSATSGGVEWIDNITGPGIPQYQGDGSALTFTFTLTSQALLKVVDGGFAGDQFQVKWVRNGLGQTIAANVTRPLPGLDLAVLELDAPLPNAEARWASRDPFAGSPGFVADYPPVAGAEPAWPRVRHGFLGGATLASPIRRLGVPLYSGSSGGAVFDKFGRVAGVAVATGTGSADFLTASQIRRALGESDTPSTAQSEGAAMAFDEGYEQAMRLTLQVISAQ